MVRAIGLALALGCCATMALAQDSQEPMEVCFRQADATARLACFDHEMRRRHAAAAVKQRAADNVGLQGPELRKKLKEQGVAPEPVQPIVATLVRLLPRPQDQNAFELDNGQIWEQAESMANLDVRLHDTVTIKPGVLGAFFLTTPRNQRVRVHRIH